MTVTQDGAAQTTHHEPLSAERLQMLLAEFLRAHGPTYGLRLLGYFGSYARNTPDDQSDVDIVFDTDTPNLFLTVMLKQDLEAALGRPIDLVQVRGLTNPRLAAAIERDAVYVRP